MLGNIGDESADHGQRHQKGRDEAQRDLGPPDRRFPCKESRFVEDLDRSGAQHGGHSEEEAEFGRRLAPDAHGQRAHDGRGRAAGARHHRQALNEADREAGFPRQGGHPVIGARGNDLFQDENRDPAHDQGARHDKRTFEHHVDRVLGEEADDRRRQEAEENIAHETHRLGLALQQTRPHRPEQ